MSFKIKSFQSHLEWKTEKKSDDSHLKVRFLKNLYYSSSRGRGEPSQAASERAFFHFLGLRLQLEFKFLVGCSRDRRRLEVRGYYVLSKSAGARNSGQFWV